MAYTQIWLVLVQVDKFTQSINLITFQANDPFASMLSACILEHNDITDLPLFSHY
jgi:hypothetical protein